MKILYIVKVLSKEEIQNIQIMPLNYNENYNTNKYLYPAIDFDLIGHITFSLEQSFKKLWLTKFHKVFKENEKEEKKLLWESQYYAQN